MHMLTSVVGSHRTAYAAETRDDWDREKETVMYRALGYKFRAHAAARAVLLGTGDAELVENSPTDRYWGCGRDGTGLNRLGQLLMRLRRALRQEAARTPLA